MVTVFGVVSCIQNSFYSMTPYPRLNIRVTDCFLVGDSVLSLLIQRSF